MALFGPSESAVWAAAKMGLIATAQAAKVIATAQAPRSKM
jgi:hypothetical protein